MQETSTASKNILDNKKIVENVFLNEDGTYSSHGWFNVYEFLKIKGNTNYTISRKNFTWFQVRIVQYDLNKTVIANSFIMKEANDTNKFTFVTNENARYIKYSYAKKADIGEVDWTEMMLEEGENATAYVPFVPNMPSLEYPSEIQGCGDNINFSICNKNLQRDNWVQDSDTVTTLDISNFKAKIGDTITVFLKIDKNISGKSLHLQKSGLKDLYSQAFKINKDITYAFIKVTESNLNYFNDKSSKLRIYVAEGINISDIQMSAIEKTEQNTSDFVEHEEQSFTIPTQKTMYEGDRFVKIDGIWKEEHNWKEKILDGTQGTASYNSWGRTYETLKNKIVYRRQNWLTDIKTDKSEIVAMSNRFKGITFQEMLSGNDYIERVSGYNTGLALSFDINDEKYNTVEKFLNYLKEKEIHIHYKLATAEYTDCTQEQSDILNQIEEKAHSYKNVTHIYCTDAVSCNFDVEYYKDLETMFNNITAMSISNASEVI